MCTRSSAQNYLIFTRVRAEFEISNSLVISLVFPSSHFRLSLSSALLVDCGYLLVIVILSPLAQVIGVRLLELLVSF